MKLAASPSGSAAKRRETVPVVNLVVREAQESIRSPDLLGALKDVVARQVAATARELGIALAGQQVIAAPCAREGEATPLLHTRLGAGCTGICWEPGKSGALGSPGLGGAARHTSDRPLRRAHGQEAILQLLGTIDDVLLSLLLLNALKDVDASLLLECTRGQALEDHGIADNDLYSPLGGV
jgi:hypothetical protein